MRQARSAKPNTVYGYEDTNQADTMGVFLGILVAVAAAVGLACVFIFLTFAQLWINAKAAGIPLTVPRMAMMRLRHVNPEMILAASIRLWKSGSETSIEDLEAHVLAGGDLDAVVDALIMARKAGLDMNFGTMAALSLAGRDVKDAMQTRVNPKIIVVPPAGSGLSGITGVAGDGIRLAVRARVTVRTRLDRIIGGAGEQTVTARVGEGIVSAIGQAESHRKILEKPETISEYLLDKALDSGTSYEILSVDIADVDVLDNVQARLTAARADADTRIARARAETRRAAALAAHQEMTARTVDSRSRVTAAKATEPLAVASALSEANMGKRRSLPPTFHARLRWRIATE